MPPAFMMAPASTNSGSAIRVKVLMPATMVCGKVSGHWPERKKLRATAVIRATIIGTPSTSRPSSRTIEIKAPIIGARSRRKMSARKANALAAAPISMADVKKPVGSSR